ncbi:hypothetical protein [Nocardiopsis algeriensis]|uniref:Uncharacterized protein n=1 Tax=Nocardiopsis algeriensis TaxID=1478215 RepID=A0A841ISF1_9ACTN|nr:hypothetical protein [Nocardiopsis algeriensis]MBB6121607.1 hypothetical protein [Nocardiopsis algeriensis]
MADDHAAMRRLFTQRYTAEQDTTPTLRGIGRQFPALGGATSS